MSYTRLTKDEYRVEGNYGFGNGYEVLTYEDSYAEVKQMIKCYRENEKGIPFRITKHRIKILKYEVLVDVGADMADVEYSGECKQHAMSKLWDLQNSGHKAWINVFDSRDNLVEVIE